MKTTHLITRLLLVLILWNCFIPPGHSQTLGEVLRALQKRNQLIQDQVQSYYAYPVNGSQAISQNPIVWNGLSQPYPTDPQVNALPFESQMALLQQGVDESQILGYFVDDRKIQNGLGRIEGLEAYDANPLPRVTDITTFRYDLRMVAQALSHAHGIPWQVYWVNGYQDAIHENVYFSYAITPLPPFVIGQWPKIVPVDIQIAPFVQTSSISGTLEIFTDFNYAVTAMEGLKGSFDDQGDTLYLPTTQMFYSQSVPASTQELLPVLPGVFGGDWSNLSMMASPATDDYIMQFQNPSAPVFSDFPNCNYITAGSQTVGGYGDEGNAVYYDNNTISYTAYYFANFGSEFTSSSATSGPPEAPPPIRITPHFERGELVIRLANNPENDCELVLESGNNPLATRNSLDVRGVGNWEAIYSGRPEDREPEITNWPGSSYPNYSDPGYKRWLNFDAYVHEWWHPVLTQLVTATYAVNVTQIDEFSYRMDFYRADQVGTKNKGRYSFSGKPIETFIVANPSGDDSQPDVLMVTTNEALYNVVRSANSDASVMQWEMTVQPLSVSASMIVENTTVSRYPNFKVVDQYSIDGVTLPTVTSSYPLTYLDPYNITNIVETSSDGTRTTSYTYNHSSSIDALASITQTGGPNPYTITYDSNNQVTDYSSGSNEIQLSYSGQTRVETDLIGGSVYRKSTTTFSPDLTTASTSTSGQSDATPTIVQFYPGTDPTYPWAPELIQHPDGTVDAFSYGYDYNNNFGVEVDSGGTSPGYPTLVTVGTASFTTVNGAGQVIEAFTLDIQSGATLDFATATSFQSQAPATSGGVSTLTPFPTTFARPLGTTEKYTYDGEGRVLTHTDQLGKLETLTRDSLDRVVQDVRAGLTYTITYEPSGTLGQLVSATDGNSTRTETDLTSPFGNTETTTITGPENISLTRTETPTSITTATTDSTTAKSLTETFQKTTLSDSVSGNATEPWNVTYTFPGSGWTKTVTHGTDSNLTSTATFDPLGRITLLQSPDPNGSANQATTKYSYSGGLLSSVTDPDGTTGYAYNLDATLEKISRGSRYLALDRVGSALTWKLTDATQTLWQKSYDPASATVTTLPWGDASEAVTNVASVSGSTVNLNTTGPNGLNANFGVTDGVPTGGSFSQAGQSQSWTATPDAFGGVTALTVNPGSGGNLTYNISPLGLPTSVQGLVNATESDSFDSTAGQTTTVTRNQNTYTQQVLPQGYLAKTSGYSAPNTTWTAPAFGQNVSQSLTTSAGTSQFNYSLAGTLLSRTFPDNSSESFTYSAGGALSGWSKPNQAFSFNPNQYGEPQSLTVGGATVANFTYDNSGQVASISDGAGTHNLTYSQGQLASETVNGQTVSRTYDSQGRVTGIALPGNVTVGYTYASDGTLANVKTAGQATGTWSHYDKGTGRAQNFALGAFTGTTAFDQLGRVTGQTDAASAASVSMGYAYTFDDDGHCSSETTPSGAIGYGYNGKGYLNTASGGGESFTYNFDEAGRLQGSTDYYPVIVSNPTTIIVTGSVAPTATVTINSTAVPVDSNGNFTQTYTPPAGSWAQYAVLGTLGKARAQVIRNIYVPPASESIGYDGDGNRTSDAHWNYQWNSLDQMTCAIEATAQPNSCPRQVDFTNDAQGRRVEKRVSLIVPISGSPTPTPNPGPPQTTLQLQSRTTTLYDGWRPVMDTDYDGSGNVTAQRIYTWGPDASGTLDGAGGIGGLVEIKETRGGATTLSVPITDGQGNIMGLIDEKSGQLVAQYVYGPFGEVLGEYGPRSCSCPLRFSTRRYDSETGFYCFGKRYYDPVSKTWLSRDPARESGGTNLYAYCGNDPIGNVDPYGLGILDDIKNGTYQNGVYLYNGSDQYFRVWWSWTGLVNPGKETMWDVDHALAVNGNEKTVDLGIALIPTARLGRLAVASPYARSAFFQATSSVGIGSFGGFLFNEADNTQNGLPPGQNAIPAAESGAVFGAGGTFFGSIWETFGPQFSRFFSNSRNAFIATIKPNPALALDNGFFGSQRGSIPNPLPGLKFPPTTYSPILITQKQLSLLVNKQGAVIDRWLATSNSRWPTLYRQFLVSNPNAAAGLRGRFLDIRTRLQFQDLFGQIPGVRIDETIPNSGSNLRPDLYFPTLDARSVIFDVGSPTKIEDIQKYNNLSDVQIPLIPSQWIK